MVSIEQLLAHRSWVRQLARHLVEDAAAAEDVEQEAWLEAMRHPPRDDRALRGWWASVVRGIASKGRRQVGRRARREEVAARPEAASHDEASLKESRRLVAHAITDLPEPDRTMVLLRYFGELGPSEIGERTGCSADAVRRRLHRARADLRDRLDRHFDDRRISAGVIVGLAGWGRKAGGTAALGGGVAGVLTVTKSKMITSAMVAAAVLGIGFTLWWIVGDDSTEVETTTVGTAEAPDVDGGVRRSRGSETPAEKVANTPAVDVGKTSPPEAAGDPNAVAVKVVAGPRDDAPPVAGADVTVVHDDGRKWEAMTLADGRAVFPPEAAGTVSVWAEHPARGRALALATKLEAGDTRIVLTMGKLVRLEYYRGASPVGAPAVQAAYEREELEPAACLIGDRALQLTGIASMAKAMVGPELQWRKPVDLRFEEDGIRLESPVSAGRWRLFVVRPTGRPYITKPFSIGEADEETTVRIPLSERRTRRHRFIAADTGQRLAGASLRALHELGDDTAFFESAHIVTDSNGEADLYGTLEGRPLHWWLESGEYVARVDVRDADLAKTAEAADGVVEVTAHRGAHVDGEAWDRDGRPAAGQMVVHFEKGHVTRATVDDEGKWKMGPIPASPRGHRQPFVLIGGYEETRIAMTKVAVRSGETSHVILGRRPDDAGGVVRGRFTTGGRPLPGVLVMVGKNRKIDGAYAKTDAQGWFEFANVTTGPRFFQSLLGSILIDDFGLEARRPLDIRPGETTRLAFDLPGGALDVKVVDAATDAPIEGAIVGAYPLVENRRDEQRFPGYRWSMGWSATTDAKGIAKMVALPVNTPVQLRIKKDGYEGRRVRHDLVGLIDSPTEVTIRLETR